MSSMCFKKNQVLFYGKQDQIVGKYLHPAVWPRCENNNKNARPFQCLFLTYYVQVDYFLSMLLNDCDINSVVCVAFECYIKTLNYARFQHSYIINPFKSSKLLDQIKPIILHYYIIFLASQTSTCVYIRIIEDRICSLPKCQRWVKARGII